MDYARNKLINAIRKARYEASKTQTNWTVRAREYRSGFYYTPEETDDHKRWDYVCTITPKAINTPPLTIVNHIARWRKGER